MRRLVSSMMTIAVLASACGLATMDGSPGRGTAEGSASTRAGLGRVPKHPSLPYYVVTVEPVTLEADGASSASMPPTPGVRYGWGPSGWGLLSESPRDRAHDAPPAGASEQMATTIANQLVTALGNAGNVRVIDYAYYWQRRDKPVTLVHGRAREVGPFVIRGSVTEFNEIAEATGSSTANPAGAATRRIGSVAMDLRIIDPTNGRIVATVVARGRVTSESGANGFSLFAFGKPSNAFGTSALGQANRAAMNSAARQVVDRLSRAR